MVSVPRQKASSRPSGASALASERVVAAVDLGVVSFKLFTVQVTALASHAQNQPQRVPLRYDCRLHVERATGAGWLVGGGLGHWPDWAVKCASISKVLAR